MSGIREEFEAYVMDLYPSDRPEMLARNELVYLNPHIQNRWLGWQASRAALRVELPEPVAGSMSLVLLSDVRFALQQAGIEVK